MLACMVGLSPMLATVGAVPSSDGWAVEPKWDGWRVLVSVDDGVRVRTRRGRPIDEGVPELAGLADCVPRGTVLDGELIVGQGRSTDFYKVAPRLWTKRPDRPAVTFVAFDVLAHAGESLLGVPCRARRQVLEQMALRTDCWATTPSFDLDAPTVLEVCEGFGLEGVVVKRLESLYLPGRRSRSWRKIKTAEWRTVHGPLRHER